MPVPNTVHAEDVLISVDSSPRGGRYMVSSQLAKEYRDRTGERATVQMAQGGGGSYLLSLLENESECAAIGSDRTLDLADSRSSLGILGHRDNPPLSRFQDGYYRKSGESNVMWVGLGWIRFSGCDLMPKGECDPTRNWTGCDGKNERLYCIEEHQRDTQYVVKMKAGFQGFPIASMGIGIYCSISEDSHRWLLEEASSEEMSAAISQYYLLTGVGNGRAVRFELYKSDGSELIAVSEGEDARPAVGSPQERIQDDGERNTCGGQANACPMMRNPADPSEYYHGSKILDLGGLHR